MDGIKAFWIETMDGKRIELPENCVRHLTLDRDFAKKTHRYTVQFVIPDNQVNISLITR